MRPSLWIMEWVCREVFANGAVIICFSIFCCKLCVELKIWRYIERIKVDDRLWEIENGWDLRCDYLLFSNIPTAIWPRIAFQNFFICSFSFIQLSHIISASGKLTLLHYLNSNCHAIKLNWKWQHLLFAASYLDLWYRLCCVWFRFSFNFISTIFAYCVCECNQCVASFLVDQPPTHSLHLQVFLYWILNRKLFTLRSSISRFNDQSIRNPATLYACNFNVCEWKR